MIALSCAAFLLFLVFKESYTAQLFSWAMFGRVESAQNLRQRWKYTFYESFTLFFICLAIHALGILFVIGLLFIPTVIVGNMKVLSLAQHYRKVLIVSIFSVFLGFLFSLMQTNLSTVPSLIMTLLLFGGALILLNRFVCNILSSRS